MKNFFYLLFACLLFFACDDGDKIVTIFNFDAESDLKLCHVGSTNVLYIVNSNPDEAIAFNFSDEDFDGTFIENDISQTLIIEIGGNNNLIYRIFDSSLSGGTNYFCSGIPPAEPKIQQEYISKNGGYIELKIYLTDQEIDEAEQTITRTFETHATAHDVTFKNVSKDEEIVEEILKLGFFTKTATFDLSEIGESE